MNLRISEDDTGAASVFNSEFRLAVLASYSSDRAGEVISLECFDVLDFEGVKVEVVEAQQGYRILIVMEDVVGMVGLRACKRSETLH